MSKSELRRIAAMKGEQAPEFGMTENASSKGIPPPYITVDSKHDDIGIKRGESRPIPSFQEVARRRGELLREAMGDFMSIKEAMDKQSSALAGSVAATCEYQIARIDAEIGEG